MGQESVSVRPLARQRNEELAIANEPGIDGGTADGAAARSQETAAGEATEIVCGEGGSVGFGGLGAGARRLRPLDGHGPKCGTGCRPTSGWHAGRCGAHRSASAGGASVDSSGDRRPGVVTASVATRRNSSVAMIGRIS